MKKSKYVIRNRKKLTVLLVFLILALLAFLGIMVQNYRDHIRHEKLQGSIIDLKNELEERGLDKVEYYSKCRHPKDDFDISLTIICSTGIKTKYDVKDFTTANRYLMKFGDSIAATKGYYSDKPLTRMVIDPKTGNSFGPAIYRHTQTGTSCGASYNYDKGVEYTSTHSESDNKSSISFDFNCNDISWFKRTFDFGG